MAVGEVLAFISVGLSLFGAFGDSGDGGDGGEAARRAANLEAGRVLRLGLKDAAQIRREGNLAIARQVGTVGFSGIKLSGSALDIIRQNERQIAIEAYDVEKDARSRAIIIEMGGAAAVSAAKIRDRAIAQARTARQIQAASSAVSTLGSVFAPSRA